MANNKKTGKTSSKRKKPSARKSAPSTTASKKASSKKKTVARKPAALKKKASPRKATPKKISLRINPQGLDTTEIERSLVRARAAVMSGDLQGLSRKARAASESVDELLEEGNAYEAGILQGVEEAEESDEGEVLTHEVLADDVPEEYLDED